MGWKDPEERSTEHEAWQPLIGFVTQEVFFIALIRAQ